MEELIYKYFRDEDTIWFDFIDYVKTNFGIQRKGLSYRKKNGRYEIYLESEECDFVLLDVLEEDQGYKLEKYIEAFRS